MMTNTLSTTWGEQLDPSSVLPEYPRPQLVRESYLNLNGSWEYAITQSVDQPEIFEGEILVPFSPEASLSGVNRQLQPQEYLHYRRKIYIEEIPADRRLLLHFGAVDQSCQVFVNGWEAGSHVGGYLPFTCEITSQIHMGENTLWVAVRDVSDTSWHSRGKQKLERGGIFYTAQSGIWQTVWMEWVPKVYVKSLKIIPCFDDQEVKIKAFTDSPMEAAIQGEVLFEGKKVSTFQGRANEAITVELSELHPWTPETPCLYDLQITCGEDRITSYFAMRKFSVMEDEQGILRYALNNKPYFFCGVLDQGYWPEGLYTPPADEALIYDIQTMKELGFNTLRKHVKVECARWYYHCDHLGMVVWQDMVNGGTTYLWKYVCIASNIFGGVWRNQRDNRYRLMSRVDLQGRKQYYRELQEMVKTLFNVPSIALWTPFNEGWGQFDAAKATFLMGKWDPWRLIDEASGWFDQGGGDTYSLHNYWKKLKLKKENPDAGRKNFEKDRDRKKASIDQSPGRVTALTECGGYAYPVEGHTMGEAVYGYRKPKTQEELTRRYGRLIEEEILPNIANGLSAMIYTQLSDVEDEVNGFLTYDRKVLKMEQSVVAQWNRKILDQFN